MTRKARNQHVAVSFDGLTDAVTNLTGAIILLVVLVLGITAEAPPQPSEGEAVAEGAADRTVESLLQRAQAMRLAIRGIEDAIRQRQQELPELERRLGEIPAERPVVVLCHSGSRSALATQELIKAGRPQVANLRGGLRAWQREGLPLEHNSPNPS